MKWNTYDHCFCEGILNIQIIYSLLTINGISSFMYHWTGSIGWALYDEYPMIISIFLGNIYIENLIPSNYKKYKIVFYVNSMLVYLVINVMEDQRLIFPYYFAGGLLLILYNIHRFVYYYENSSLNNIIIISYNTYYYIAIIIISAITWGLTEISCKNYRLPFNNLYLLGHPMWHFMISYGFYNLIQIIYNIKLYIN